LFDAVGVKSIPSIFFGVPKGTRFEIQVRESEVMRGPPLKDSLIRLDIDFLERTVLNPALQRFTHDCQIALYDLVYCGEGCIARNDLGSLRPSVQYVVLGSPSSLISLRYSLNSSSSGDVLIVWLAKNPFLIAHCGLRTPKLGVSQF
jgi:hypothetical protein